MNSTVQVTQWLVMVLIISMPLTASAESTAGFVPGGAFDGVIDWTVQQSGIGA